jgi:hypothetical protein
MGPRIYTPREVSAIIPDLNRVFEDIDKVRDRIRQNKKRMDVLEMIWGDEIHQEGNTDRREYIHFQNDLEDAGKDFEALTRKIVEMEGIPKSVDHGIVDFYGVIDSRLVFLCWKRGEERLTHYHHLDEGFEGRKPVPQEELTK